MYKNYLGIFQNYFAIQPVDRTNTLKYIPGCSKTYEIDLSYKTDLDLKTIINNRAKQLSKYNNLILFWSGGIDSTLVFYALIENNIDFEIVISQPSKEEYLDLYNKIVNKEFPNIKDIYYMENYVHSYVKDKIIVTDECGDQIMGSMKYLNYSIDNLKDVYTKHVPADIIEYFDEPCQLILQDKEATLAEYLWSMNFVFKYIDVNTRFPGILNRLNLTENNTSLAHFFNTKDFQAWSIQNYKTHCSFDKIEDYKIAYKQYIFDINGDEEYFKNKVKVPSLSSAIITTTVS